MGTAIHQGNYMNPKTLLVTAALALAISAPVQARHAPLVNPPAVAIPAGLSDKVVVKEVKRALLQRGWEIDSESPGVINSTLHLREHVAKIRVTYADSQVKLAYVDSTNLDYRKSSNGSEEIHPNYLNWMQFLSNDIKANLGVASLGND